MNRRRVVLILLLLSWMGLIFWFSAQSGEESSALSGGLLRRILSLTPHWNELSADGQALRISTFHTAFRKLAHFSEYAVLGVLASLVMREFSPQERYNKITGRVRCLLIPACFALLCAAADELHQAFVPDRAPSPRDVCIDLAGACAGILALALVLAVRAKRKTDQT